MGNKTTYLFKFPMNQLVSSSRKRYNLSEIAAPRSGGRECELNVQHILKADS